MYTRRRGVVGRPLVSLLLLMMLLSLCVTSAFAGEEPIESHVTCDVCLGSGHAYICTVPITDTACFLYSGDVYCTGDTCTCCRSYNMPGCKPCKTYVKDPADIEDDDVDVDVDVDSDDKDNEKSDVSEAAAAGGDRHGSAATANVADDERDNL